MHLRRAMALLLMTTGGASAQSGPVERAGWLAGCWEQRAGTRVTTEMWMTPFGGAMLGSSRTVIDGRLREFEYLRLTARGDTLIYTASPSGQSTTEFRATSADAQQVTFENRAHDFPQLIRYRRTGADSIVARIEGPGPNNTTRGIDFPMRRVNCTDVPAPTPPPDTQLVDAVASRDAQRLLVVKGVSGNMDVYVTDRDGRNARRITDHASVDYQPAWSPDGSRLAFVSARDGHQEIYVMRPDGSGLTRLTNGPSHNTEPDWSPRGDRIAFRSERDGRPQLYVMNADGSNLRALTQDTAGAGAPAWSPDGRRLAFTSRRDGHSELHVMGEDGTGARQLTRTAQGHSGLAMWSPDGRSILFWTTRDGNAEVYVMNSDGSNPRNLSQHAGNDLPLGWTPDGRVLFRSTRDRAAGEIYRIRPDGTDLVRLDISR